MTNSHIPKLFRAPFALMADLYHLTMAYGFWKRGLYRRRAVFELFHRKNPFGHPFTLAAGLQLAADLLAQFRFSADDIQYLGGLKGEISNRGLPPAPFNPLSFAFRPMTFSTWVG